jgi:hypothetical protein
MKLMAWVSGSVLLGVLLGFHFYARQASATFHHMDEVKARLAAAGFICTVDSTNGTSGSGFLISRESVSWSEVGVLCKAGAMGPEWVGKVWVTMNPAHFNLVTLPDQAAMRAWGEVVAFGDDQLLQDIDAALAAPESPH